MSASGNPRLPPGPADPVRRPSPAKAARGVWPEDPEQAVTALVDHGIGRKQLDTKILSAVMSVPGQADVGEDIRNRLPDLAVEDPRALAALTRILRRNQRGARQIQRPLLHGLADRLEGSQERLVPDHGGPLLSAMQSAWWSDTEDRLAVDRLARVTMQVVLSKGSIHDQRMGLETWNTRRRRELREVALKDLPAYRDPSIGPAGRDVLFVAYAEYGYSNGYAHLAQAKLSPQEVVSGLQEMSLFSKDIDYSLQVSGTSRYAPVFEVDLLLTALGGPNPERTTGAARMLAQVIDLPVNRQREVVDAIHGVFKRGILPARSVFKLIPNGPEQARAYRAAANVCQATGQTPFMPEISPTAHLQPQSLGLPAVRKWTDEIQKEEVGIITKKSPLSMATEDIAARLLQKESWDMRRSLAEVIIENPDTIGRGDVAVRVLALASALAVDPAVASERTRFWPLVRRFISDSDLVTRNHATTLAIRVHDKPPADVLDRSYRNLAALDCLPTNGHIAWATHDPERYGSLVLSTSLTTMHQEEFSKMLGIAVRAGSQEAKVHLGQNLLYGDQVPTVDLMKACMQAPPDPLWGDELTWLHRTREGKSADAAGAAALVHGSSVRNPGIERWLMNDRFDDDYGSKRYAIWQRPERLGSWRLASLVSGFGRLEPAKGKHSPVSRVLIANASRLSHQEIGTVHERVTSTPSYVEKQRWFPTSLAQAMVGVENLPAAHPESMDALRSLATPWLNHPRELTRSQAFVVAMGSMEQVRELAAVESPKQQR